MPVWGIPHLDVRYRASPVSERATASDSLTDDLKNLRAQPDTIRRGSCQQPLDWAAYRSAVPVRVSISKYQPNEGATAGVRPASFLSLRAHLASRRSPGCSPTTHGGPTLDALSHRIRAPSSRSEGRCAGGGGAEPWTGHVESGRFRLT